MAEHGKDCCSEHTGASREMKAEVSGAAGRSGTRGGTRRPGVDDGPAPPGVCLADPAVFHERLGARVGSPVFYVERPVIRVGRPILYVERPVIRVGSPVVYVERPVIRVGTPVVYVERPVIRVGTPVVYVERPVIRVGAPVVYVERPDIRVGGPVFYVERPDIRVGTPVFYVERPDIRVGTPVVYVERPDIRVGTPVVYVGRRNLRNPAKLLNFAPRPPPPPPPTPPLPGLTSGATAPAPKSPQAHTLPRREPSSFGALAAHLRAGVGRAVGDVTHRAHGDDGHGSVGELLEAREELAGRVPDWSDERAPHRQRVEPRGGELGDGEADSHFPGASPYLDRVRVAGDHADAWLVRQVLLGQRSELLVDLDGEHRAAIPDHGAGDRGAVAGASTPRLTSESPGPSESAEKLAA